MSMPHYHVRVGQSQHQRDSVLYYSRDMKTLAERLIWAREQREMSQQTLADRVGVSQSTIGNLEAGIRQTARKLPQMAHALGISALWLAEGRGDPFAESPASHTSSEKTISAQDVIDLISLFSQCDEDGRRAILAAARGAAEVASESAAEDQLKHG